MHLYACKVRLHGSVMNEVPKEDVTACEVMILRLIHGDDAIVALRCTGDVARSDEEERARLSDAYGAAFPGKDIVRETFGVSGVPIPKFIPGVPFAYEPTIEKTEKRKPGRPAKTPEPAADPLDGIAADETDED